MAFPSDLTEMVPHYVMLTPRKRTIQDGSEMTLASQPWVQAGADVPSTVALPVPADLSDGVRVEYNNEDLNIKAGISQVRAAAEAAKGFKDYVMEQIRSGVFGDPLSQDAKAISDTLGKIGQNFTQAGNIDLATGTNMNPFSAVFFKSVGFREIQLSYAFTPKNYSESETLQKIVRYLRMNALPDSNSVRDAALKYPVEWNVKFGNRQALDLFYHPCVLMDVQVGYHGHGYPVYFDRSLMPASVSLSLTFQETIMPSRKTHASS